MEIELKSSNLHSAYYDNKKKKLSIKFTTDKDQSYIYSEVPKKVFDDLLKAESKGKFFHQFIKNKFKFEKIKFEKEVALLYKYLDEKDYIGPRNICQMDRKENGDLFIAMVDPYGLFIIKPNGIVIDDYEVFS